MQRSGVSIRKKGSRAGKVVTLLSLLLVGASLLIPSAFAAGQTMELSVSLPTLTIGLVGCFCGAILLWMDATEPRR